MSHHDHRARDSRPSTWSETGAPSGDGPEVVPLSAARARATEEAAAAIARELNGPLTALMLYMNELKQQSHQFSQTAATASTCSRSSTTPCSRPSVSTPW
jgi:hypothetical protein